MTIDFTRSSKTELGGQTYFVVGVGRVVPYNRIFTLVVYEVAGLVTKKHEESVFVDLM